MTTEIRPGELSADVTNISDAEQMRYIAGQAADARLNVEIETDGMTLNMGPLRTYPQVTTLINRIDWLGSFANEVPFILAAEELMEVEAPPRAQYIRTILFELSRIANIALFLGDMGVQLGAVTPVFLAFRDREFVLNQIEAVTGGRFHPNFDRIGGLKDDLPAGWIEDTKAVMATMRTFWATRSSRPAAAALASFRPTWRSATACPERTCAAVASTGTSAATCRTRWPTARSTGRSGPTETRESTKIVDQLLDNIPSGPIMAKVPRIIKVPPGEAYVATENPLGAMGYYIVSQGELVPFRVKIRTASFSNMSIAPWLLEGVFVPDIITILASLYFILGDLDR